MAVGLPFCCLDEVDDGIRRLEAKAEVDEQSRIGVVDRASGSVDAILRAIEPADAASVCDADGGVINEAVLGGGSAAEGLLLGRCGGNLVPESEVSARVEALDRYAILGFRYKRKAVVDVALRTRDDFIKAWRVKLRGVAVRVRVRRPAGCAWPRYEPS